jgi:hypothetical protein
VGLHEGTRVTSRSEGIAHTTFVLARAWRCRAYCDSVRTRTHADVNVPGYGICRLDLADGKHSFVPDPITWGREIPSNNANNLSSLQLHLKEVERDELILRLLTLVGRRLRKLDLTVEMSDRIYTVDLSELAVVCPDLENLVICNCNVTTSNYQALHGWGLRKLSIASADIVCDLASCLSDPTCRMARQLLTVLICVVLDEWGALDDEAGTFAATTSNLEALEEHDGDYLPIAGTAFPVQSKVAMISVVEQAVSKEHERAPSRFQVMSHMDSSVLGLIFAFAAEPARREVEVTRL